MTPFVRSAFRVNPGGASSFLLGQFYNFAPFNQKTGKHGKIYIYKMKLGFEFMPCPGC
jgi:hypothetical protein